MTTAAAARRRQRARWASPADRIYAPPDQPLIPPELRSTMPGFCTRCDRPAMVPLGGVEGLCAACKVAEVTDRTGR